MPAEPPAISVRQTKQEEGGRGFFRDLWNAHFVANLLLALTLAVVAWQARLTGQANQISGVAATAAKDAATAAKESVGIAKDTANKQLRAYVLPTKAQVLWLPGKVPAQVRVTVRNSGQTPAHDVVIKLVTWWQKVGEFSAATPTIEGSHVALAAGEELFVDRGVPRDKSSNHVSEMKRRREELHVDGLVSYRDVFGEVQESHFHFVQGGPNHDPLSPFMTILDSAGTAY